MADEGLIFSFYSLPARLRITHIGEDKKFMDPDKTVTYVKMKITPVSNE